MKILFTAHQFFPESRAGVEIVTLGLAKELRSRGHQTFVLAAKRSLPGSGIRPGEIEDYEHEDVPVRRVGRPEEGTSRPFRLNFENAQMAARAREYVREVGPDVVHAMHLQGLSASILPTFQELGLPVVFTAADFWTICPVVDLYRHDGVNCEGPEVSHCVRCLASRSPDPRLRERAYLPGAVVKGADLLSRTPLSRRSGSLRRVAEVRERPAYIRGKMKSVDRILVYTRLTHDLLSANGVGAGKTTISHYGIDASQVGAARLRRELSPTLRVGFVGTLAHHKGPDLAVRALRTMPDADVQLEIHGGAGGDERYVEKLRTLAAGDGRVRLRGAFSRGDLGRVFAGIDALVVPSRWYENAPAVIFESFAAGAPVIAANLGGMSEFVRHGEDGLLFLPGDAEDLARQLRRLVEEPDLLERLRSGIGPVKTDKEYAGELEEVYESLVRGKARA